MCNNVDRKIKLCIYKKQPNQNKNYTTLMGIGRYIHVAVGGNTLNFKIEPSSTDTIAKTKQTLKAKI